MQLGEGGRIAEGSGPNEFFWWCEGGSFVLAGMDGKRKCCLQPIGPEAWEGSRLDKTQLRVRISPLESTSEAAA